MTINRRPSRRLATLGVVLALSASLAAGCGQGSPDPGLTQAPSTTSPDSPSQAPPSVDDSPTSPVIMPNLVGQQYESAFAQLAKFNVRVVKHSELSAEPIGTVVAQEPPAGDAFSQDVSLTVSAEPAVVPNVVGRTFGDAQQSLVALGLKVVEVPNFEDARLDGTVIQQNPPAGTKNAGEVTLTVVRRPVQTYLSEQEPVQEDTENFRRGTAKANGEYYTHALEMSAGRNQPSTVEYDLSRDYRRLVGAVAVSNNSRSDTRYRVEIYGDDRELFSATIKFGDRPTKTISCDVTGVLRLQLSITQQGGSGYTSDSQLVFGEIRAQGLESEVQPSPEPSPTES